MGCTSSSAPNTISPNAYTAGKSIQSKEETDENPSIKVDKAEEENQTSKTKVLPTCDSNEERVQLITNIKSSTSLTTERDVLANGHVIESVIDTPVNTHEQVELKVPKLELLMDKVFETNHHLESDNKANEGHDITTDSRNEVENTKNHIEEDTTIEPEPSHNPESEVENTVDEKEREEVSPSQSQSSRATRWEALADIAAELPPSLAVDPVTGQIYQIALNK